MSAVEGWGLQAHCDLILQLLCDDTPEEQLADPLSAVMLRDGSVHNTIPFNADPELGAEAAVDPQYGRHEPYTYYRHCTARERNKGLFNADQNVNNNQASSLFLPHHASSALLVLRHRRFSVLSAWLDAFHAGN